MRSTQDPIRGLQHYIEEWGVASDTDLKVCRDCLPWATFDERNIHLGHR